MLLFREHVVNVYHHHMGNGDYSFFVTSTFSDSNALNCKMGLGFTLDCCKCTLNHHRF